MPDIQIWFTATPSTVYTPRRWFLTSPHTSASPGGYLFRKVL